MRFDLSLNSLNSAKKEKPSLIFIVFKERAVSFFLPYTYQMTQINGLVEVEVIDSLLTCGASVISTTSQEVHLGVTVQNSKN